MGQESASSLETKLRQALEDFSPRALDDQHLKHAAVAITVLGSPQETVDRGRFLLTRRAPRLNTHAGQWALPGGRVDPGETAEQAALRELAEECGLQLSADRIIGRLDDYPTRSGYRITPIVVWAGIAPALTPNPAEVAAIHTIPVTDLDDPRAVEFLTIPESDRPVIRLHLAGSQVHAPTAALIYQFHEVAIRQRATRVVHLEQPVWAWR